MSSVANKSPVNTVSQSQPLPKKVLTAVSEMRKHDIKQTFLATVECFKKMDIEIDEETMADMKKELHIDQTLVQKPKRGQSEEEKAQKLALKEIEKQQKLELKEKEKALKALQKEQEKAQKALQKEQEKAQKAEQRARDKALKKKVDSLSNNL